MEEGEPGVHREKGRLDGEGQGEAQEDPEGGLSPDGVGQEVLKEEARASSRAFTARMAASMGRLPARVKRRKV